MAKRRYTREAMRLQPFIARMSEYSSQIVIGETLGNNILLYHADDSPVAEFAATDTGLDLASAAVVGTACQIVIPSNASLSVAHTLAGCTYVFPPGLVVSGTLTTVDGTRVYRLQSIVSGTSAAAVVGVIGPASGEAHLVECTIAPANTGAGGVHAVEVGGDGTLYCRDCQLDGRGAATGTPGYAGYRVYGAAGSLYVIDGGAALGLDASNPFNE